MAKYKFPEGFLWGTATSAHQIEGNNKNSDWWQWEQSKDYKNPEREYPLDPSGIACDSYNRYEEDFDLCKDLNNNAVRISIEWARLEPKQGEFDQKEFNHYKKVLQAAKDRGLKTFVTLHHFTNPIWFSEMGGWAKRKAPRIFAEYAAKCAEELGELCDTITTINEPQVYALQSYTNGMWPPNKINPIESYLVQINMASAHNEAYDAIKKVNPDYKVGIVKNIVWYQTRSHKFHIFDQVWSRFLYWLGCDFFLGRIRNKIDFIGLNYYFTSQVRHVRVKNPNDKISDLGWWLYPAGIEQVLMHLKRYNVPVYITENGLADSEDKERRWFLEEILKHCSMAIEKGAPLRGYFHWSLLDNYEWHHGFWPRFGLVEIDRENNLERKPRKSFYYYKDICKNNSL